VKLHYLQLRLKLYAWIGLIIYGCLSPATALPKIKLFVIPHFDKFVHFTLFFGLGILLIRHLIEINHFKTHKAVIVGFIFTVLLATSTEVLQNMLPINRDSDLMDLLADFIGIAVSIIAVRLLNGFKWFRFLF
jgi:VanZ family protein